MTDNIDMKEWLPRNAPLINPFRLQHGDLDGITKRHGDTVTVVAAWRKDQSILSNLIEKGFLEEIHLIYGLTLLELRNSVYGHLNAKSNSIYIALMNDSGIPKNYGGKMYDYITRPLKHHRVKVIFHVCESYYNDDKAAKTISGIEAYRQCFDHLVVHTDYAIQKIKDEIEKGLADE